MLGSVVITLFVFVAATAVVAAAFVVWLVAVVATAAKRGVEWVVRGGRPLSGPPLRTCPRLRCGQVNRGDAKYCRRCGRPLEGPSPAAGDSGEDRGEGLA